MFHGKGLRHFGVELEIDDGGTVNSNAEKLLDIANKDAENLYIKTDGSLDEGLELVTHPMTLDYHLNEMPWAEVLRKARSMNYLSHAAGTCGLHVHISRLAFGCTYEQQEAAIARLLYFVEKFWAELLRFSRRTQSQMNRWVARYGICLTPSEQMSHAKTNMHEERIIFTTNQLIFSSFNPWSYPYNKGIKTGHTSQAGNCFVGYAEYGDAKLYSVVLGSAASSKEYPTVAASFTDTKSLYKWGFTHFKTKTVAKKGDTLAHIKVDLSTQTDQLVLTAKTDLVALLPADVETDSLEATPNLPEAVDAPIKAGDVVGSMTYSYNGTSYGTVELVALSDVEMSRVLYYSDKLSHFFQSTVFKIVLIAAAIFIVLYILFNITFGGIRRRRRRKAMRKRYDNDDYPRRHRR